ERAGLALICVPAQTELTGLLAAIMREAGGDAEQAMLRAAQGLAAVTRAARACASVDDLLAAAGTALGTSVILEPAAADDDPWPPEGGRVALLAGDAVTGFLTAPAARGDLAVAARLVLHAAAAAAARTLNLA